MIEILNLRKTKNGYLANGHIDLLGNDAQVIQWLKDGKEVLPMFTDAEIEAQIVAEKVAEALGYLVKTNHKFYIGYIPKKNEDLVAIKEKRDEALLFIRANDVSI